MPYRPPFTGSFDDPRTPATVNATVDESQQPLSDANTHAQAIINDNAGAINRFVDAQRQAVASGVVAVFDKMVSLPSLDVYYTNQFGRESIRYVPHPRRTPPTPKHVTGVDLDTLAVIFGDKDEDAPKP